MFGYIRPYKGNLLVKEFEHYKAVYCGLCHTLKRNYGFAARFLINYDFTFLTVLLSCDDPGEKDNYCFKRCVVSPFKKKCVCAENSKSCLAAGLSVILAYGKITDDIQDSSFVKSLTFRFLRLFIKRSYKKAEKEYPEFAKSTEYYLKELEKTEKDKTASIDIPADTSGMILRQAACYIKDENKKRSLKTLLYHLGRWTYIIDAADDYPKDIKEKKYNPVALRYDINSFNIDAGTKEKLSVTLSHSLSAIASAFELLDFGQNSGIVENVLFEGLPFVENQVFSLNWHKKQRNRKI